MSKLTPQQFRYAVIIGLLLYVAAMAALFAWLFVNSEETLQRRVAMTPNVTVTMPGAEKPEEKVPSSWTDKAPSEPMPPVEVKPELTVPETKVEEPKAEEAKPAEKEQVTEAEKPASETAPPATPQAPEPIPAETMTAPQEKTEAPMPQASPTAALPRWQKFARPFDQKDTRPRIGLIISDLGLGASATQTAIQDLPGEISLAFSSLTTDLDGWVAKARAAGHESIVTVPMEPENYPQNDPGPNTLLTGLPDQDNVSRIRWALARADGYVAVMPFMGEKFVTVENKLAPVLDVVHEQGLLMLDSTLNKNSLIAPLSRLGKVPFTRADLLIDAAASRTAIDAQLQELEKLAKERGQAVGIALPYPVTFEKLKTWIATLESKGIVLAPLTALASEEVPVMQTETPAAPQAVPATEPAKPAKPAEPDPNRPNNELVE